MLRDSLSISMLLVVLALCSCATSSQVSEPNLMGEAEAQAQKIWDSRLSKCGGFYYAHVLVLDKDLPFMDAIVQLKDVTFPLTPLSLSEADRLNGLEWLGFSMLTGKVSRTRFTKSLAGWSKWKDGNPDLIRSSVVKIKKSKQAGWEIKLLINDKEADEDTNFIKRIECSELPPESSL